MPQDASSTRPQGQSEDNIYAEIRDAIGTQKLPPGTRLREDEMRQIFGVSRTRIRQVFARLAYDGLVVLSPNRGASVACPSPEEAHALFAARRAIEAGIIAAVVERIDVTEKEILKKHVDRELVAEAARDREQMIRLSGEFHLLLARMAGNSLLERFLTEMITRESLVIQLYEKPGQPSCSGHEHKEILAALVRRDCECALHLMRSHLYSIERRLQLDRIDSAPLRLDSVFSRRVHVS